MLRIRGCRLSSADLDSRYDCNGSKPTPRAGGLAAMGLELKFAPANIQDPAIRQEWSPIANLQISELTALLPTFKAMV